LGAKVFQRTERLTPLAFDHRFPAQSAEFRQELKDRANLVAISVEERGEIVGTDRGSWTAIPQS
jgi:hypothetical protein